MYSLRYFRLTSLSDQIAVFAMPKWSWQNHLVPIWQKTSRTVTSTLNLVQSNRNLNLVLMSRCQLGMRCQRLSHWGDMWWWLSKPSDLCELFDSTTRWRNSSWIPRLYRDQLTPLITDYNKTRNRLPKSLLPDLKTDFHLTDLSRSWFFIMIFI